MLESLALAVLEPLEIPLYDDDMLKLLVRFGINCVVVTILVCLVYYKNSGTKDFLFTYFMINVMVFFICFTLKKFDLGLGMALGLFAIFGILRYRTDTIPIKEMTYLFMVIGIAVVNSLANKKMSYAELAFTNIVIVLLSAFLENLSFVKREMREQILYEKIELAKPARYEELLADLEERTGLKISRIELGQINFLNDTVEINVYYFLHEQESINGVNVTRRI
ncbi:DUF4956 domain-containing protein [Bythopirellula goksoeyrii]|uniref:DUF4956 domain-containing protein n=1 Tax=Bythopirellula goksoeyrii TaxID=1400387 RepID=A0A5B9QD31_9BACT|nr:DUF4956 domain-containing protein [Bythopirellula goksoeyrii]QEG35709.1 hypothetical protein Pr1d_30110 [Bythopirellula goksoeyrii]